ncbi:MAG: tRNA (guanosine(37)-N1)-methyltransferase TrmD [Candidatus Dormibacteria bacterium]
MRFDVVTLFPEAFPGPAGMGVVGRALQSGLIKIETHDLRRWGMGSRRQVDDIPFGGGPGMVLRPEPLFAAVREVAALPGLEPPHSVLLSAPGRRLDAATAAELARYPRLLLVCGRYEGVDERVRIGLGLDEISIGDFVISGGELAALVLIDAVARQLPGTLGDPTSVVDESFADGLVEYPHYTRPAVFENLEVPAVLRSGDHAKIAAWRSEAARERTSRLRPDLLAPTGDGDPLDDTQRQPDPAAAGPGTGG